MIFMTMKTLAHFHFLSSWSRSTSRACGAALVAAIISFLAAPLASAQIDLDQLEGSSEASTIFRGATLERAGDDLLKVYPGTIGFSDGQVRSNRSALVVDVGDYLDTGPGAAENNTHYAVFATADHEGSSFLVVLSKAFSSQAGTVARGSSVAVSVGDVSGFAAGQVVSIEASPVQLEVATILAVTGSGVVLDSVKSSYAAPTLRVLAGHRPEGVSLFRLIGWVYYFRGSLLRFRQVGRTTYYEEPTALVEVANGSSTSFSPNDVFLPPIRCCRILLCGKIKTDPQVGDEAHLLLGSNGLGIARDLPFAGGYAPGMYFPFSTDVPCVARIMWYRVTSSSHKVNIIISGYEYDPSEDWNDRP